MEALKNDTQTAHSLIQPVNYNKLRLEVCIKSLTPKMTLLSSSI